MRSLLEIYGSPWHIVYNQVLNNELACCMLKDMCVGGLVTIATAWYWDNPFLLLQTDLFNCVGMTLCNTVLNICFQIVETILLIIYSYITVGSKICNACCCLATKSYQYLCSILQLLTIINYGSFKFQLFWNSFHTEIKYASHFMYNVLLLCYIRYYGLNVVLNVKLQPYFINFFNTYSISAVCKKTRMSNVVAYKRCIKRPQIATQSQRCMHMHRR